MRSEKKAIIATVHSWNILNARRLKVRGWRFKVISDPRRFTVDAVCRFSPDVIFFPHWSWIIQPEIFQNYECVVFHMTDLPYGRGGSPLQNLIVRGHAQTKISAIRVGASFDGGPVYCKTSLSLKGTAEQIFKRASDIVFSRMIPGLLRHKKTPKPQTGRVIVFKRRKPEESDFSLARDLKSVYDFIRMLDAPGYPKAYLKIGNITVKFSKGKLCGKSVVAEAEIAIS